jgi:hypothetical protein
MQRFVEHCPFCGGEVDRAAAGSAQVNVLRSDALPLGDKPLGAAIFGAHTACLVKAMLPGHAKPIDSWPS